MRALRTFGIVSIAAGAGACSLLTDLTGLIGPTDLGEGLDGAAGVEAGGDEAQAEDSPAAEGSSPCDASSLGFDPQNCGACGHICDGGGCGQGVCTGMTLLATGGRGKLTCLDDDTGSLYWGTDRGDTLQVPKQGGVTNLLYAAGSAVRACSVDTTGVYEPVGGSVFIISLTGGMTYLATMVTGAGAIVRVSDGTTYWTSTAGTISACYKQVSCKPTLLASAQSGPYDIAADSAFVYWTNRTGGTVARALRADPGDGGVVTTTILAMGQNSPSGIAVDTNNVYWANQGGSIALVPLDGGAPAVLTSAPAGADKVAINSTSIYWTNPTDGTVMKIDKDGKNRASVASGQMPSDIAADDTSVYWINSGPIDGGTVMKAPK